MTGVKVLVVEDEAIIAMELEDHLAHMGYEVIGPVSTGAAALEKMETMEPDLVLMDIRLKTPIDGIETAEEIRARFGTPVIFLTAFADPATLQRAKRAAPFGYLIKPFRSAEVRAAIEMAIYKHSAELRLREQAIVDPLTGLFNRRFLNEVLPREFRRARRAGSPLSIAMVDIDRFKSVNDTYGHDAGDQVIRCVAETMSRALRKSDLICRYGGDEFMIILPDTGASDAGRKLDQIRQDVRCLAVPQLESSVGVTISIGLATLSEDAPEDKSLVRAADAALYRAKQSGRDRVCTDAETD